MRLAPFQRWVGWFLVMDLVHFGDGSLANSNTFWDILFPSRSESNSSTTQNDHNRDYYFTTTHLDNDQEFLGRANVLAAAGNPLKGLAANPGFTNFDPNANTIDAALEFHYIGLDEVLVNDPAIVGIEAAFDWTALEERLDASHQLRHRHSILSFHLHYPGKPLQVPDYLMQNITTHYYPNFLGGGRSPDYGDPLILRAIQQFVQQFGLRYDGDVRIAFIHAALLGFWGEWHTVPHNWVPEESKELLTEWYAAAFTQTHISVRYPFESAYRAGFGYNDGSFAFNTLNGDANGGIDQRNTFWPSILRAQHEDFWKWAPMGGETRPHLQPTIFEASYPAGTYQHQDFFLCVNTTHATYMHHQEAFVNGGYKGDELERATLAHAQLGYNYIVERVAVAAATGRPNELVEVEVDVTIKQIGVAPFYYPLSLILSCNSTTQTLEGVESIIEEGQSKVFTFTAIPATAQCLELVSLRLFTPYQMKGRPIRFAQGENGEVSLRLPLPPQEENDSFSNTTATTTEFGKLSGLTLVRVYKDGSWDDVKWLHNNDEVNLSEVQNITIRADPIVGHEEDVDTVEFWYNGILWKKEVAAPFVMGGNRGNEFNAVLELNDPGNKTVTALAYDSNYAVVGNVTIHFAVVEGTSAAPSAKVDTFEDAAPTSAPTSVSTKVQNESESEPGSSAQPTLLVLPPSMAPSRILSPTTLASMPPTRVNTDNVHGFNTPATPDLLDLVDTPRGANSGKGNKKDVVVICLMIGSTMFMLMALCMGRLNWMVERRRNTKQSEDTDSELSSKDHLETGEDCC